jgi:hypothetical protein
MSRRSSSSSFGVGGEQAPAEHGAERIVAYCVVVSVAPLGLQKTGNYPFGSP